MIYTFVDSPLWYLRRLEERQDLESPLEDQVSTLKAELGFMRTYLMYLAMVKDFPSESTSSVLSNNIEASLINSTKDLSSTWRQSQLDEVGPVLCSMLETVKYGKPEIRKAYATLWDRPGKNSYSSVAPPVLDLIDFVDSILDNLNHVLAYKCLDSSLTVTKNNIEFLVEELRSIGDLIGIIEKRQLVHQKMGAFLTQVQTVATMVACLSYFCWFDEIRASSLESFFSDSMKMVKRCTSSGCVDMYLELLKGSKDIKAESFVHFLLGADSSDLINAATREELVSLLRLSVELSFPGHCSVDDLRQVSADIKAVAEGAAQLRMNGSLEFYDQFQEKLSRSLQNVSLIRKKIIQLNSSQVCAGMVPIEERIDEGLNSQTAKFSDDDRLPWETEYLLETANDALLRLLKKIEVVRADVCAKIPVKYEIENLKKEMTRIEELKYVRSDHYGESQFLQYVTYIIKAELFLLDIRDAKAGLIVQMVDQAEHLQNSLRFLRIFLMNPSAIDSKERELIRTKSEATALEAASVIFSLYENGIKENTAMEMNPKILDVLKTIEPLKLKIRKVYLRIPPSLHCNLPAGLVFLSSLLRHIEDVLNNKAHSIRFVKLEIEMLQAEFESLTSFLSDTANQRDKHEELKDLWTCIADVAYEAEFMIDSSVFGGDPEWYFMLWIPFAMDKIKHLKWMIQEIYDKEIFTEGFHDVKNSSDCPLEDNNNIEINEFVVGLDSEADFLIDQLIGGSPGLNVVSIIGAPGLGKTTLAEKIYNNSRVRNHFDVKVWCSASQEYQRRKLLSDIFLAIYNYRIRNDDMDESEMTRMMWKILKTRYLIVIDNLWHTEAWDDLRSLIPKNNNGSRVLLTSQLRRVCLHANPDSDPYCVRQLSGEESWRLMQNNIFGGEDCPEELLEDGKKISEKCKGIPLVLVLMAGQLKRRNNSDWKKIAKSLGSESFMEFLEQVLELCYRSLAEQLKPCFIYFGAFTKGEAIPVTKLLRLWIAEGFVESEEIAEEYLADLIGRNLVLVSKTNSRGDIKTCGIHDMLWDFCKKNAEEENLLLWAEADLSNSPARRLCIRSTNAGVGGHPDQSIPSSMSTVRSLLFPLSSVRNPKSRLQYLFVPLKFRLVTVVDMESINTGNSFPGELMLLELLRYLAVKAAITSLPSSLDNLWNLQTLIVKGMEGSVELPNSFWKLKRLRHVHIHPFVTFQEDELFNLGVDVRLENLLTFSALLVTRTAAAEIVITRFPSLRKLKYYFQLESPNIDAPAGTGQPDAFGFSFPLNLNKLTLSGFRLPWTQISTIARLPNLEVLKLLDQAFVGELWDLEDEQFLRLRYLKLVDLDLAACTTSSDTFPSLELLVVHRCKNLKEIYLPHYTRVESSLY